MSSPERIPDRSALFDLLAKNIPVAFFLVDPEGIILEFNKVAQDITGYTLEQAKGRHCSTILRSNLCHTSRCPLFGSDVAPDASVSLRATIKTRDNREIPIMFTLARLLDDSGRMRGGIGMFRDMSGPEQMEKQKQVLISMFAHDLKAPLAITGGFLTRLLKGKAGPLNTKQEEYIRAIDKEIRRLDGYIRSFLDILRMEAGQVSLALEPCSIDEALHELTEGFRLKAAEKHVRLKTEIPDSMTLVMADKKQLQRVMSNLLDNAIKYAPEGSTVLIRVYETPVEVVFQIHDSGPGISEEDYPYIFDPFYRGKRSAGKSVQEGSGLGLAIVKSIVEIHGGKTWVISGEDGGTTFYFTIPKEELERGKWQNQE